jgi:N6-adenosine-specific RNA methylase IME4
MPIDQPGIFPDPGCPNEGTPRVIVADPAWAFNDKLPGAKRGAAKNYKVEHIDRICGVLDRILPPHSRPDVLSLWRVGSMQREALTVIDAWGYEDPTSEIVWEKTTKNGKPAMNLGRTVRNNHEIALICKRKGTPGWKALGVVRDHGVRSVLEAPVPEGAEDGPGSFSFKASVHGLAHSEKPPEFYELIDRLFFGPVLELYARRQWRSWYCIGCDMPQGHPGRIVL